MTSTLINRKQLAHENFRGGRPRRNRKPVMSWRRFSYQLRRPIHPRYENPFGWKMKRCYILLEVLSPNSCRVSSDVDLYGWDLRASISSGIKSGSSLPKPVATVLALSRRFRGPIVSCKNRALGCLYRSYWQIIFIHEDVCPYPRILCRNTIVAKLNWRLAPSKFGVFCRSFSRMADILLLYRRAQDMIRVRVMHYSGASRSFKLSFTDGKSIYDVSGHTGISAIFSLPSWVMNSSSNILTYAIELEL